MKCTYCDNDAVFQTNETKGNMCQWFSGKTERRTYYTCDDCTDGKGEARENARKRKEAWAKFWGRFKIFSK